MFDRTGEVAPTAGGALHFEAQVRLGGFALDAGFEVGEGEVVSLVGPNGSGKSACLNLIAGLLRPDQGRITLGETVLCDTRQGVDLPPGQRRVGVLFQEYALFPHLSVRRNVAYGARARKQGRAGGDAAANRWLKRLDLEEWADRPVMQLSGGQRQRVALARALASDAKILLLDEPFAALDVHTRSTVRGELREFLKEVGLPTVLVSHDPLDALLFGRRVVVLEAGRVTQTGMKEEMLAAPRTPFVASLAGLNLYEARLASGRGAKEAAVGAVVFHVLADELSGPAYLAFPPSEVTLSLGRMEGSAQNAFQGSVKEVLPLPDRLRVLLDIGVPLSAEVTREAGAKLPLVSGQRLWATIKATAIQVYP